MSDDAHLDVADRPPVEQVSWWRRPLVGATALFALLAYLPALIAAPGRMTADSKLYLYLDPGRLMSDALGTFDPRQFAGWVPHQHISFVWPAGPWYWSFEQLGAPDWIAHRMWLGTLLLVAALGVRWCALQLGLTTPAALVAAVSYELAPYILPYVSRTSVMLLPWAGLGWIVALTIRATRRPGWRDPALIALVVLTVGAVNATALAMIVPAPTLWLVHAVWGRWCTWRAALLVAVRTAVLSLGVSLWWIAALAVQGQYGADVLPYSESLADVSFTATSAEVWRGMGYWLFYIRDPYGATTTASLRYLSSSAAIAISFLVPVVALGGLVWVRWAHRRFAMLLVAAGVVLAVGVHPIGDRSPLMRILTGDGEEGLALALRSSTRALPVMNLGLALALGSIVAGAAHVRWRSWFADRVVAAGLIGLVLVNVPAIWTGAFVDPALERDQDPPAAWTDAAATLDATGGGRVIMLPGTEFGAYRWGYTVDQPLPGLTERDVITRDLLPLGSPAAMDLWYAFDDRIQDGVAEYESLEAIARLFGADVVWLTNDVAFDRFGLARPESVRELVLGSAAVVDVEGFGEPVRNVPTFETTDPTALADPSVGTEVAPVELVFLDTSGRLARAYDRTLLMAGSGDGVVDLAAVGLLPDGVGVRYAADDASAWPSDVGVVVTDSNRDQARHWRSSQDVRGFTEVGGDEQGVLDEVASDTRLPVFDSVDPSEQTTAVQVGPVTAVASAYGEPFAYTPEHRAVMAIDGGAATSWVVGEHGDPIGERIRLEIAEAAPTGTMRLLQATSGGDRRIATVAVTEGNGELDRSTRRRVPLTTTDDGWSLPIELADDTTVVEIEIVETVGGTPFTPSIVAGVGFAEIDLGLPSTLEVVVPPDLPVAADVDTPTGWVLTRWRTDPLDPWRSDPEPTLVRRITTPDDRTTQPAYTARIDARADDAALAELFGWPVVASNRLVGSLRNAGVAAFDGDLSTGWMSDFDAAIGATLTVSGTTEPVGRVVLTQPRSDLSRITEVEISGGGVVERVAVVPDPDGTAVVNSRRRCPPVPCRSK
ncbi:MAG: alpha-(1-_3)-arabinofuranosyltransferase family protein [Ilumatobacteraceae bacterium]